MRLPRSLQSLAMTKQNCDAPSKSYLSILRNSGLFHFVFWLLVLTSFCAKKLPPTSPDRFAPRLKKIETVDRLHIRLKFSEPIDTRSIAKDDFSITADSSTLRVLSVSSAEDPNSLLLLTEPQKLIGYDVHGLVRDTANNITRFQKSFIGSTQPDTVPPHIIAIAPSVSAVRVRKNFTIRLIFSEPMDTTKALAYAILPGALKNRIGLRWAPDQAGLSFAITDSLGPDTTVYFIFAPTLPDLEGNPLVAPGFTVFTTDSALPASSVSGSLKFRAQALANGVILFYQKNESFAGAISDYLGGFSVPIAPGAYSIKAFADTAATGTAQLFLEQPTVTTETKNLELELKPLPTPMRLNELLQ